MMMMMIDDDDDDDDDDDNDDDNDGINLISTLYAFYIWLMLLNMTKWRIVPPIEYDHRLIT